MSGRVTFITPTLFDLPSDAESSLQRGRQFRKCVSESFASTTGRPGDLFGHRLTLAIHPAGRAGTFSAREMAWSVTVTALEGRDP
jgi:hypothetical protein